MEGLLIKAISGAYYVLCEPCEGKTRLYTCKARGIFRNENRSPLVGDRVTIGSIDEAEGTGVVTDILPRKNELTRPAMANLDRLFLVSSVIEPAPSLQVIDRLITVCEYKGIDPVLIFTKTDLSDPSRYADIYVKAGFKVISLSSIDEQDTHFEEVAKLLRGKITGFAGNTGAGKSTLLNRIAPGLRLSTGEVSKKLGRGKHTTRHIELYYLDELSCFVADTPGFGTMELLQYETIKKEQMQYCFREFAVYIEGCGCKYTGCSHRVEKGCRVLQGVEDGEIAASRHESYKDQYEQAAKQKEWEHSRGTGQPHR